MLRSIAVKAVIAVTLGLVLTGCATQQTDTSVSSEQSQFYEGKAILPFLAEHQAETPEEAMSRGDNAIASRDLDRALFNYIRAYELDKQNSTALVRIGDIHYQRGNFNTSFAAYQTAIQVSPDEGAAHKGSGMILLQRKSYNAAETSLTQAVEYLQDKPGTEQALIESYTGLGIINDLYSHYETSARYYLEAARLAPKSAMVKSNLGYSYYMQQQWDKAEATLRSALLVDNSYAPAWKNLGLTYARQEKYLDALTALEQVMETSQAYNDIGYICMISKRYDHAAQFFRKAIKAHPKYYPIAQQNLTRVKRLLASNPDGRSKL